MGDQKDLPLPETELPKPEKNLPLPEKEISSGTEPEEGKVINDKNSNYSKTENNLGGKAILIVILLILLYPIGVILMWFKTRWPKWVKFLLTIPFILGILGFILGILFLSKIASNDLTDKIPPSEIQVTTPTPTPTSTNKTTNWKMYTNSTYKFSFYYPDKIDNFSIYAGPTNLLNNIVVTKQQGSGSPSIVSIWIYDTNSSKNDFLLRDREKPDYFTSLPVGITQTGSDGLTYVRKPNIVIDGIKAYVLHFDTTTQPDGKPTNTQESEQITLNKGSLIFLINTIVYSNTSHTDLDRFYSILSTFKFTDSNSQTSTQPTESMVACTMEAKLCPDGETYVGRTGPNCEFAKCP